MVHGVMRREIQEHGGIVACGWTALSSSIYNGLVATGVDLCVYIQQSQGQANIGPKHSTSEVLHLCRPIRLGGIPARSGMAAAASPPRCFGAHLPTLGSTVPAESEAALGKDGVGSQPPDFVQAGLAAQQ